MKNKIFYNEAYQKEFDEVGYVSMPFLNESEVNELRDLYYRLNVPDKDKTGLHSVLSYSEYDKRKEMHEGIMKVVEGPLNRNLKDRSVLIASYLTKTKEHSGLVCCHQDFTMCDEAEETSIFAWIPLMDVDKESGALGFIPGSHRFFDYERTYPFPVAQTPVEVHRRKLTAFTKILPMKSTDIVFFNTKTIHGSFPNDSGQDRIAINISIRPKNQLPYLYYLKPNGKQDTIIKYHLDEEFYYKYSGLDMYNLYNEGKIIEDYPILEEKSYDYGQKTWSEMRAILKKNGVKKDRVKVREIKKYFNMSFFERF